MDRWCHRWNGGLWSRLLRQIAPATNARFKLRHYPVSIDLLARFLGVRRGFGPLLTAASTACSNRSRAPGSVSISSGLGFLGGFAMAFDPKNLSLAGIMSPHRRLPKQFEAATKEFADQVGAVIWAWNYCHAAFCDLFGILVNRQNLMIGYALWHTSQSDTAQREFLLSVAKITLAKRPRLLTRVAWAKRSADSLSTVRNDVTHTATVFSGKPSDLSLMPSISATAPKRLRRLEHRDLNEMCFLLKGDLIALGGYVRLLGAESAFPGRYTLPKRPRLLSIPDQPSKTKRRRTNTKRPRPPRSSRA